MSGGTVDDAAEVEVREDPAAQRFEIWVDGVRAGLTQYVPRPDAYVFPHTEIDPAFGGRGLATTLIRAALDAIRERGVAVLPSCEFVQGFIRKHPDYLDLVPADRRAAYGLGPGPG